MISEREFKRLHTEEWERLKHWEVSEFRRDMDSFLSVACGYFTDFETDEHHVVDAFVEYLASANPPAGRPGSLFEQFVSDHLARIAHRYGGMVTAARKLGRTDQDEELGWKLDNELAWRLGGEIGNRGDWRANKLFVHAAIADRTLTPYLGLSRIRAVARSGAILVPSGEQEFIEDTARWLAEWEEQAHRRPDLEATAQQRATTVVEQLINQVTALQKQSHLDEELDKLPPTRWI